MESLVVSARLCARCVAAIRELLIEPQRGSTRYERGIDHQSISSLQQSHLKNCPICRWTRHWVLDTLRSSIGLEDDSPVTTRMSHRVTGSRRAESPSLEDGSGLQHTIPLAVHVVVDAAYRHNLWKLPWYPFTLNDLYETTGITRYEPSESTGSQNAINLVSSWMHLCQLTHPRCQPRVYGNWRPTRLVHLVPSYQDTFTARLVLAEEEEYPFGVLYVTLSHRWLTKQSTTLVRDSLCEFRHRIPLQPQRHQFVRRWMSVYAWIWYIYGSTLSVSCRMTCAILSEKSALWIRCTETPAAT